MSSIIISADRFEVGHQIARKTAEALGFDHLDRGILESVAKQHELSGKELGQALDGSASSIRLWSRPRDNHLAYIQSAVLDRFVGDNVVCEGLAAHLFVREVSHVLMVRVLSDLRVRANKIAASRNISPKRARRAVEREDQRRRRWSLTAFGLDETNPSLYDLVISLSHIEPDRAVKIISDTVSDRKFQPMTYSRKCVQDMALAARVRAALVGRFPRVTVQARDGTVIVMVRAIAPNWKKKAEKIRRLAGHVAGVDFVEVHRGFGTAGRVQASTP